MREQPADTPAPTPSHPCTPQRVGIGRTIRSGGEDVASTGRTLEVNAPAPHRRHRQRQHHRRCARKQKKKRRGGAFAGTATVSTNDVICSGAILQFNAWLHCTLYVISSVEPPSCDRLVGRTFGDGYSRLTSATGLSLVGTTAFDHFSAEGSWHGVDRGGRFYVHPGLFFNSVGPKMHGRLGSFHLAAKYSVDQRDVASGATFSLWCRQVGRSCDHASPCPFCLRVSYHHRHQAMVVTLFGCATDGLSISLAGSS